MTATPPEPEPDTTDACQIDYNQDFYDAIEALREVMRDCEPTQFMEPQK